MTQYDFFISHAGADKSTYIEALVSALEIRGATYWLDSSEVKLGDSIALRINEGLKSSRFVVLCLSQHFLRRPWPETELGAALAAQNSAGVKKVIPLIFDSKDLILQHYPILAGFAHMELSSGVEEVSDALVALIQSQASPNGRIKVTVESVPTEKRAELWVVPRVSLAWLVEKLRFALDVSTRADAGTFFPFMLRWILVDERALDAWRLIPRVERRRIHAVVAAEGETRISYSDRDRLADVGIYSGIVFHLYPIEDDENYPEPDWPAKALR